MTKFFKKKTKKGSTLVELIGVMIVIAIIAAIAIGGIIAARDRANVTNTQSDLRTYENAAKQVMMAYPDIMKYKDGGTDPKAVLDLLNAQLETEWQFTNEFGEGSLSAGNVANSGAIGYSTIKRDAWDMPYALYLYTDTNTTKYTGETGAALEDEDSCLYLVIASAGKNSTGVGVGTTGDNIYGEDNHIKAQDAMINNTDGVDDMGIIVRILNGDVYSATFGFEGSTLGVLKGKNWIFGATDGDLNGVYYDAAAQQSKTTVTEAGSLDEYPNEAALSGVGGSTIGSWA